jgi:RNA polymerase-binding transcription factor DksA
VTDIFDDATDAEMRERDALVEARQAHSALATKLAAAREAARGPGPAICIGCELAIPEPRRQAVPGCLRCTRCERQHDNQRSCAPR